MSTLRRTRYTHVKGVQPQPNAERILKSTKILKSAQSHTHTKGALLEL